MKEHKYRQELVSLLPYIIGVGLAMIFESSRDRKKKSPTKRKRRKR